MNKRLMLKLTFLLCSVGLSMYKEYKQGKKTRSV